MLTEKRQFEASEEDKKLFASPGKWKREQVVAAGRSDKKLQ